MKLLSALRSDFIEKITGLPYFLFMLSLVLFADTYLVAVHHHSVRLLTDQWLSSHDTVSEAIAFLGSLGFFYAVLVPGLLFFVGIIQTRLSSADSFPSRRLGWVEIDVIRNRAIESKNALLFQNCDRLDAKTAETKRTRELCFAVVLLSIAGYVLGSESNPGLAQFIFAGLEQLPWYVQWPMKLAIVPFVIFVIAIPFSGVHFDGYTYWPEFDNDTRGHANDPGLPNQRDPAGQLAP